MSATLEITTECDILSRVIDSEDAEMSLDAARAILQWRFPPPDVNRMQELADRSTEGELSDEEHRQLESYVRVGQFLAILQAKARLAMMSHGDDA